MKRVNYGKYTGEDFDIDAGDLMRALADFLLQSGFRAWGWDFQEVDQRSMEELRRAVEKALLNGELFSPEDAERMQRQLESMTGDSLEHLVERLTCTLF